MDEKRNQKFEKYESQYFSNAGRLVDQTLSRLNHNEEIVSRIKGGANEWNKWAAEFKDHIGKNEMKNPLIDLTQVNLSHVDYSNFNFPVNVKLGSKAKEVDLSGSSFDGELEITGTEKCFYKFINAKFDAGCRYEFLLTIGGNNHCSFDFTGAIFKRYTDFSSSVISKIRIDDCKFIDHIPDFRYSNIKNEIHLLNVDIPENEEPSNDAVLKYRKLKELAIKSHDHEQELKFSACELRANRRLLCKTKRTQDTYKPISIAKLTLDWSYDVLSNYGRSIARPFLWFVAILFTSYWINTANIGAESINCSNNLSKQSAMIQYTFKNSFPLFPLTRQENVEIRECIFGGSVPPYPIKVISVLQLLSSTILLFLIVLGLRNRFKIK